MKAHFSVSDGQPACRLIGSARWVAAVALSSLAVRAAAQSPIYTVYGNSSIEQLGIGLDILGDVDLDGFDDFIAGTNYSDEVTLYSGKHGTPKYVFHKPGSSFGSCFGYGSSSGAGDVNGDGRPDVIVGECGAFGGGAAHVYSGMTGALMFTLHGNSSDDEYGNAVDGAGDVDLDGYADLVIGAWKDDDPYPPAGNEGSVSVVSGKTKAELFLLYGDPVPGLFHGQLVAGVGDVNADGNADVAACPDLPGGYARVYSGAGGAVLHNLVAPSGPGWSFGSDLEAAGDVDLDGQTDVIVGERYFEVGGVFVGAAHVFSGASGALLYTFQGSLSEHLTGSVGTVGDLDADGRADVFVTGYPPSGTSSVHVYTGATGSELVTITSGPNEDFSWVAGGGDVNGDGSPDIVVSDVTDSTTFTGAGFVRAYSCKPLSLTTDIHLVTLTVGGTQTLRFNAGAGLGGNPYFLLGTTSGPKPGIPVDSLLLPLTIDGYLLYTLGNPNQPPLSGSLGVLSASGTGQALFTLPTGLSTSLVGLSAWHAYLVWSGSGFAFASNASVLTFQP